MGCVLSANWLKPDPEKVKAIQDIPAPTDKQSVQHLIGMTNCLQKFAPRPSEITTPLREFTKNDNKFLWNKQLHGTSLEETKKILSGPEEL